MIKLKRLLSLIIICTIVCSMCCMFAVKAGSDSLKSESAHPRIFVNSASFEKSKELASGAYSDIYASLVSYVDGIISDGESYYDYETNLTSNYEDNWMRTIASDIEKVSFLYKLTGDEKYLETARKMVNAAISYPSWGRNSSSGNFENKDLACSHMLIAISCAYDWLYDEWSEDEKTSILTTLIERGIMLQNDPWWKGSYLSNHLWIGCTAVLVTASAIYDEYDSVSTDAKSLMDGYGSIDMWFDFATSKMNRAFSLFPDDGSLHEGMTYYIYGMSFLQEYVMTAEKFLDFDVSLYSFWQNTSDFLIDNIIENEVASGGVEAFNFGDSTEKVNFTVATQLYYFANKYSDGRAYASAQILMKNIPSASTYGNWKLMLYGIEPFSSGASGVYKSDEVFGDTGYAFSHAKGGASNSGAILGIKCGIPGGIKNTGSSYNYGLSHVHPDNNSFNIFSGSKRLFTDDGYTTLTTSEAHNTLSVNGKGQYGEVTSGTTPVWSPESLKSESSIIAHQSGNGYFYAAGDATLSYPAELGINKFVRHFVFLKPDVLILIDDISSMEDNGSIKTLNFHPAFSSLIESDSQSATFTDDKTALKLQSLTDDGLSLMKNHNSYDVTVSSSQQSFCSITAISWGGDVNHLAPVSATVQGNAVHITVGNDKYAKSISVDLSSYCVTEYNAPDIPLTAYWNKPQMSIDVKGISEPGEYITCKAYSDDGSLIYLNQTTASSSGSYTFSFAPESISYGDYSVSLFDSSNNSFMNIDVPLYAGENRYSLNGFSLEFDRGSIVGRLSADYVYADTETMLILAEYDAGGNLINSEFCNVLRYDSEGAQAQASLKYNESSDHSFRLFVWDGNLRPVAYINN